MTKRSSIITILTYAIILCISAMTACADDPTTPDAPEIPDTPELAEPQDTEPAINTLTINGVEAQKAGDSTYTVKLAYDVDVRHLSLEAEAPGAISIGDITLDEDTSIDLSQPLTLTITTISGKSQNYILAVRYSDLPVIYVETPKEVTGKDDWVKNGRLSIFTDTTDVVALEKVQYKGRGNTTWSYAKKPYAIKLNSKTEILGMPKHKRWVLLANYLDKTLMRNAVAFEIGRCMSDGLGWTPRGRFVDVVFNGNFIGNYYLCEQIKIDKNRVNITEMEASDTDDEARTGGYLLEYDTYFDEVNKFRTDLRNMPVNIKDPDEDVLTSVHFEYIKDYINDLERSLAKGFSLSDISGVIDVNSFIDWWIANELLQNSEPCHPKSCYFHKDRNGALRAGPLWDYDYGTLCNVSSNQTWLINESLYYKELFTSPDFVARVKERWLLHKPALSAIPDFIDATFDAIRESAEINQTLWPTPDFPNFEGALSYRAAVDRLRAAYIARFNWLDTKITAL